MGRAIGRVNGGAPVHRTQFTELVGQALPMVSAVGAAKQLAQVGVREKQLGIARVCGDCPRRAVEQTGQLKGLPCIAIVRAAPEFAGTAGWAIAIG